MRESQARLEQEAEACDTDLMYLFHPGDDRV